MKVKLLRKIRKEITIQKQGCKFYLVNKFLNLEQEFFDFVDYKEMLKVRRNSILYNAYRLYNHKRIITKKGY
jgi:hypothetical protein